MSWIIFAPTAISAVVATVAFLFQVWTSTTVRRRESDRRDWERLQALTQTLYDGVKYGSWAQKLAVQELAQLKTKRDQVLLLCREAIDHWNRYSPIDPDLKAELQRVFDELRR